MPRDDADLARIYEENTGRPPRDLYADDPDWTYRGTREERDALRERLGLDSEEAAVIEGQGSLFETG